MASSTGKSSVGRFGVHIAVLFFVALWTVPTLGILVTALRDKDQIIATGWWSSFSSSSQTEAGRLPGSSAQAEKDGKFVIEGNIFGDQPPREISAFGTRSQAPTEFPAGSVADLKDGVTLQLNAAFINQRHLSPCEPALSMRFLGSLRRRSGCLKRVWQRFPTFGQSKT